MAEPAASLIVALSARALVVAARRAGSPTYALDLCGDLDTRADALASEVVAGDLDRGFDEEALLAAADRLLPPGARPAHPLVYGAGFEDRPALLGRIARGRRLCGNAPDVVARAKDGHAFFALLDRLRVPHPEVSYAAPRDPEGWLVKRAGGSGGAHVAHAADRDPAGSRARVASVCADRSARDGVYWQRRANGRAIGVSFLADGERAALLGFSEQWPAPTAASPFRFGGMLQPATLGAATVAGLSALLDPLVGALALKGLNSLDALVDDDGRFHVIEVNPRPGANLDVFDGSAGAALFALHVRACDCELPASAPPQAPRQARAMSVVYAEAPTRVPDAVDWPDWIADRPVPGSLVEAGAPLCTVLATHATGDGVRRLVQARVAAARGMLQGARDRADLPAGRIPEQARAVHSDLRSNEPHTFATRPGTAA